MHYFIIHHRTKPSLNYSLVLWFSLIVTHPCTVKFYPSYLSPYACWVQHNLFFPAISVYYRFLLEQRRHLLTKVWILFSLILKQNKFRVQGCSTAHDNFANVGMDIAEATTQVATTSQADLTTKGKSRRKLGIQKSLTQECKPAEGAGDSGSDKLSYSLSNIIDLKVFLFILLSVLVVVFHYLARVKSHFILT